MLLWYLAYFYALAFGQLDSASTLKNLPLGRLLYLAFFLLSLLQLQMPLYHSEPNVGRSFILISQSIFINEINRIGIRAAPLFFLLPSLLLSNHDGSSQTNSSQPLPHPNLLPTNPIRLTRLVHQLHARCQIPGRLLRLSQHMCQGLATR